MDEPWPREPFITNGERMRCRVQEYRANIGTLSFEQCLRIRPCGLVNDEEARCRCCLTIHQLLLREF